MDLLILGNCDVKKINRKIDVRRIPNSNSLGEMREIDEAEKIKLKTHFIMERVNAILGIPKDCYKDFILRIVEDHARDAFYDKNSKYVTVRLDKLNTYVLVHELSHHAVNSRLGKLVPENMHEIIAIFVADNFRRQNVAHINHLVKREVVP